MNIQELNKRISLLPEKDEFNDCDVEKSLKDFNHNHEFWKDKKFDIYYYVKDDRVFMFEKDFGGVYRVKEIKSQDVRFLEAVGQYDWIEVIGWREDIEYEK